MATPQKLVKKLPQPNAVKSSPAMVELPDGIEDEVFSLDDFGILIYGQTGIGKSSFPSHSEKPFYFRFEQSSRSLKVMKTPILTNWETALLYVEAAERNLKDFKTMVIDTGAPAYDRCLEAVCQRLGISHPGKQKDYGASWKEVQKEFQMFFNRLASLNIGIWVLAHEVVDTHETRSGDTYSVIKPNLSGKTEEFFKNTMDIIGYYFYARSERFLLIRGNEHIMAKCNLEDNFITISGDRVVAIPMGNSSKEAYSNFISAYNNQQKETYSDILVKGGLIETTKPKAAPIKKQPIKKEIKQ